MLITVAEAASTAPPSAFFTRWADVASWPTWNADTEWVRLDGPFVAGATGVLKPKGGPRTRFVVQRLVPDREFVDVSRLLGARLVFDHQVRTEAGRTQVTVTVTLTGPLTRVWNLLLGKGIRATTGEDLNRLVTLAEAGAQADAR
jgi:hypothetical protein